MLNDIGLELVQVSGPVTAHQQVYLQAEVLLTLKAGALHRQTTNVNRSEGEAQEPRGRKRKFSYGICFHCLKHAEYTEPKLSDCYQCTQIATVAAEMFSHQPQVKVSKLSAQIV